MTDCKEIDEIINRPEDDYIEFKESSKLHNEDGKKEIGYGIVALANRHGGKIILGIRNDGLFEGKSIFDVDLNKQTIDQICRIKISPVIEYYVEFLQCDKGDVLVIDISKRKDMPHAYIVSRESAEIKNRIYYIRTSHGKRLVTDKELQWMFTHIEDPDFINRYRIVINFLKNSFGIAHPPDQQMSVINNYINLLNNISEKDLEIINKDWVSVQSFFMELTPYAILNSLSVLFTYSWLIDVQRVGGQISYMPKTVKTIPSRKITLDDLPLPRDSSFLKFLSFDLKDRIKKLNFRDFLLPENAEIIIDAPNKNVIVLSIRHPEHFSIDINIVRSTMMQGIHPTHPQKAIFINREGRNSEKTVLDDMFQNIAFNCVLSASFSFPEKSIDLFYEYEHFAKTIRDHLEYDWDWDNHIRNLPNSKLYTIEHDVSMISRRLFKR